MGLLRGDFDRVLIQPAKAQFVEALELAAKSANTRSRAALVVLGRERCNRLWKKVAAEAEGFSQLIGEEPAGSHNRDHRSALAAAWWTDRLGRRHIRIKAGRYTFNYDLESLRNIFCPFDGKRPPVWMIYPHFIYLAGEGQTEQILAACPCGVAGTLDAIGWMGDCCAACHDRREEGQASEARGRPLWLPLDVDRNYVGAVDVSPDSCKVAACMLGNGPAVVWDLSTGDVHRWNVGEHRYVDQQSLVFLPDNRTVALARAPNIVLLDALAEKEPVGFDVDRSLDHLAVSPDGILIAALASGRASVWELRTGKRYLAVSPEEHAALCAAFSPDGKRLALGCVGGKIRWWDVASKQEQEAWTVPSNEERQGIESLVFTRDGRFLASLQDSGADVDNENLLVWDVRKGKVHATLSADRKGYHPRSGLRLIAISPDGGTLVASELNATLRFWEVPSGRLRTVLRSSSPKDEFLALAFSADGRWLATGDERGRVKLWPWRAMVEAVVSQSDCAPGGPKP